MKVAMVVTAKSPGGVFSHVRDLARGLSQAGDEITLYVDAALRHAFESAFEGDLHVSVGGLNDALRARCDVWHLHLHDSFDRHALRLQLRRLIRHGRNGVILDEHLPRTPRSDASLDWEPDTPPGRKKPFGYQLKTAWKWMQFALSSRVIVHSNASAKFLSKRYHLALSKVVTIPYGVPVAPSAPFPPSGPLRVLLLAVVCFRKGHDVLIEATRYATTSWDVTFAGGGSQIETFRALAEERATQPIHFVGPLADPQGAIRDCDVLCVPSRSDASSISAIEAMMVGRPIVGSSADGVPEVFEDQETGLVVDVADPKDLAQALDALSNRERREEMGRRARERALETRTLERMTEVTRREYQESARHG